jgi:transposase
MVKGHRRCCGIDVHKEKLAVCVLPPDGKFGQCLEREYGTFTEQILQLKAWLLKLGVTEVAMESTGVYWRPVWNVLEGAFRLLLANPVQVKALAGRKSDRRDARRIAEYLQDGRLDGSFVPPAAIRHLRELTRDRVSLVEEQTRVSNQIRDLLETANIKLGNVASDILGKTGRRILEELAGGERDAGRLAEEARGKLRSKRRELREALRGRFTEGHEFRLKELLLRLEFLEFRIVVLEEEIRRCMKPYQRQLELLDGIPGVNEVVAWTLVAELGVEMGVFPTGAHCASWAGLCPGENESGGKKKSARTRRGNGYVRRALVQAGWAAAREKGSYFQGIFRRLVGRRGLAKSVVAVAHRLLLIVHAMLRDLEPYRELGADYTAQRYKAQTIRRLTERLAALGQRVSLAPREEAAAVGAAVVGAGGEAVTAGAARSEGKRGRGRPRKVREEGRKDEE